MKRLCVAVLLLTAVTGGCTRGVVVATRQGGGPDGRTTPTTAAASDTRATSGSKGAPARASGGASSPVPAPSSQSFFKKAGPGERNNMPLEVTLNRTCARRGDAMEAVATTLPNAQLAFSAAYAGDNSLIPDFTYVPKASNPTGSHTWRWVIRPQVPDGDAILSVVAAKGNKGATYTIPFVIRTAC